MQGGNHVESQVGCVQFQKLVGSKGGIMFVVENFWAKYHEFIQPCCIKKILYFDMG